PSLAGSGSVTLVTRSTVANFGTSAAALARSASVSPDGRSYTTTAGKTSGDWNAPDRLSTCVDSAEPGAHAEESCFSVSGNFWASGAAANRTSNQNTKMTYFDLRPAGSAAKRRTWLIPRSPHNTIYREAHADDVIAPAGTSSDLPYPVRPRSRSTTT